MELGSDEFRRLAKLIPHMRVHEELLQMRTPDSERDIWVNLCPRTLRSAVIWDTHGQHHAGISKTTKRICMDWYWPGIHRDIARLLKSCEVCQAAKSSQTCNSQNRQRLHAGRPWQVLSIDLMGPLSETDRGNNVVLVMTDHFTRWRDAIPLPNGTAQVVAEALETRVFCYFGIPERIHSDQGAQFESKLFGELCALWGTEKSRTTPYHPQGNGMVERSNRDLGNALRALLLGGCEEDWDLLLPHIMRSFRATPHSSTGETANFLMMGREARLPDQLLHGRSLQEDVSREAYAVALGERLYIAYEKLRTQEQRVRHADSREAPLFRIGDLVWLHSKRVAKNKSRKLQPKFTGPYQVRDVNRENHTYLIEQNGRSSRVAETRLKMYHHAYQPQGRAPVVEEPTRQPTRQGMGRKRSILTAEEEPVYTDIFEIPPRGNTTPKRGVEVSKDTSSSQTESSVITKPHGIISMEIPSRSSSIEPVVTLPEVEAVPEAPESVINEPTTLINDQREMTSRSRPRRPPKWMDDYIVSTIV